jgi:hypothetical protein
MVSSSLRRTDVAQGSKKLARHLAERSQLPYKDVQEMFSDGTLEQVTIKMFPLDKSVAEHFCLSELGVEVGSSTGSD